MTGKIESIDVSCTVKCDACDSIYVVEGTIIPGVCDVCGEGGEVFIIAIGVMVEGYNHEPRIVKLNTEQTSFSCTIV